MKNSFLLASFVLIAFLPSTYSQVNKVEYPILMIISSPDKKLSAEVMLDTYGQSFYNVRYLNSLIMQNSKLGIIREDEDFSTGLKFVITSKRTVVKEQYVLQNGKKKLVNYLANKKVIAFKNANGQRMNIIFQVSNDGVAFKYEFPGKSSEIKKIKEEKTSFHFLEGTKAWLQPKTEAQSGWEHTNPSYEAHYMMDIPTGTAAPGKNGWVYPAMFKYKNTWMLITEAGLGRTFCGTALQQDSPDNEYFINFPQEPEKFSGGVLNPQSALPWQTPWRIIAVGSLKTVAESTLGTDLAFPEKKMNKEFITPGRASWSWIMSKDNFIIYDEQKKYIDYAADMHWEYCLIDAAWDKKIGFEKIKELAEYAAKKKVGILLWYNSAGDWNTVQYTPKDKLLTHESRMKEFSLLQQMGIKGIKVDFFSGDGQSMINYYQDILEDAAACKLLVNFHGATLPRGLHRTYPNLMTTEAVYGYEMITFNQKDADVAPAHMVMCAFARNAFDPMDFTPVSLYKIPKIDRKTSVAFELATGVIFLSGIQHFVEGPEGMSKMNADVKGFMQKIPVTWDDVKFIDGFPGEYYVVARRSGKKWFIAGINAGTEKREIIVDLSFALKSKSAKMFSSGKESTAVEIRGIDLQERKKISISMGVNDGFVIELPFIE